MNKLLLIYNLVNMICTREEEEYISPKPTYLLSREEKDLYFDTWSIPLLTWKRIKYLDVSNLCSRMILTCASISETSDDDLYRLFDIVASTFKQDTISGDVLYQCWSRRDLAPSYIGFIDFIIDKTCDEFSNVIYTSRDTSTLGLDNVNVTHVLFRRCIVGGHPYIISIYGKLLWEKDDAIKFLSKLNQLKK